MKSLIPLLLASALSSATNAQQTQKFFVTEPAPGNAGSIQILDVVYGQDDRFCRAQSQVARDCDGRSSCEVRADDNLCGNPYANVAKQLFVGYSCGGDRRSVSVDEGQTAQVYCLDSTQAAGGSAGGLPATGANPPANWRRGQIYVASASYGANQRVCDATSTFSYECDAQSQCRVDVDNRLCGDPARGTRKSVVVNYWCNGRLEQQEFSEAQTAVLNCN